MVEYLYHGTNNKLTPGSYLKPNISFDYEPLVYATEDYTYALVRCGKFDVEDSAIKEDYSGKENNFILTELREGAFKKVFDTDGIICYVNKQDFVESNVEFISKNKVRVVDVKYIDNVWKEIIKNPNIRVIENKDCDAYFNEIGVDKNKYLQRRKSRIQRIINLRETQNEKAKLSLS